MIQPQLEHRSRGEEDEMLNQRLEAARSVKSEFLAAESAQDEAAIRAVRAVAAMLEGRRNANLPIGTGLAEIAKAARAAALSIEARQALVEAHPGLAQIPADIGLRAWGYGDDGHCPPVEKLGLDEGRHLQAVA